jgi:hypothetical protein
LAAPKASKPPTPSAPATVAAPTAATPPAPAAGAPVPMTEATRIKVLVLELSGLGIRADLVKNLEQYLRTSIATIEGFQVISPTDLQIALSDPKNKAVQSCGGGPDCAAQAGRLVGADLVVFGSITALGQAFSMNVRSLATKDGKEKARQQATLSGSRDLLIPETRLTAYRLIAPDKIRGWLIVEIDVAGVDVEVDGKPVGQTPLPKPVENLQPGDHVVVFKRPGYKPFQKEFTIKPFEPTRVKLTLGKAQQ